MPTMERVTVTLPAELVASIDRMEKNRSRFIADAVRHEIERRRREELLRSVDSPHPETADFTDGDLAEWAARLPKEADALLDPGAGEAVTWVEGRGWVGE